MLKNRVLRGLNGAAALLVTAWLAGGCQVQTDLADATGGAAGEAGSGGSSAGSTGGSAGSADKGSGGSGAGTSGGGNAGSECRDVSGYPLQRSEDDSGPWAGCLITAYPRAVVGCTYEEACADAYLCAVDPNGQSFGVEGCIPEGWTACDDNRGVVDCDDDECFDGTLESFCRLWDCPASLEEAVEYYEELGACDLVPLPVESGCGLTTLRLDGGFSGSRYAYDDQTGKLVAATLYSDVPFGPCYRSTYYAWPDIEQCPAHTTCTACGPAEQEPEPLACRFDCDCSSVEPLPDPCFGPETCDCYCAMLEATRE